MPRPDPRPDEGPREPTRPVRPETMTTYRHLVPGLDVPSRRGPKPGRCDHDHMDVRRPCAWLEPPPGAPADIRLGVVHREIHE